MTTTSGQLPQDCVTVVVRIRSENDKERALGNVPVVKKVDTNIVVFDPKVATSPEMLRGRKRASRDLNKRVSRDAYFAFDYVFDSEASNADVFERATRPVIDNVLQGYNACVFAYGATGAGKTYTMLGTAQNPGVTFLSVMALYEQIESCSSKTNYDVTVSYLEVYNENIRDLLRPSIFLPLREDERGVVVTGLSLHKPRNADELLHMLEFGNKNRSQHPTDANAESSRSHAVFQVFIRQKDLLASGAPNVKVGKLSLIDLAGSERATATTNRGDRFREGANINKSLLALGNCINALADGKNKGYVPYRNSKLTRLLKDSIGGNCRTVMIAAVSPSGLTFEDTYNTLKYANRAKEIKVHLKQNNLNVDNLISQYPQMVQSLKTQVAELQQQLLLYEAQKIAPPIATAPTVTLPSVLQDNSNQFSSWKRELEEVFDNRINIRKEMTMLDESEKVLSLKIMKKETTLNRLKMFVTDTAGQQQAVALATSIQRSTNAARMRLQQIADRKAALDVRMTDNDALLESVGSKVNDESQVHEVFKKFHHMDVELRDSRQHVKHLKKIARILHRDSIESEKLICALLRTVRRSHYVMKGHSLVTSDMTLNMEYLQSLLRGQTGVGWAGDSAPVDSDVADAEQAAANFDKILHFSELELKLKPVTNNGSVQLDSAMKPVHSTSNGPVTSAVGPSSSVEPWWLSSSGESWGRSSSVGSESVTPRDNVKVGSVQRNPLTENVGVNQINGVGISPLDRSSANQASVTSTSSGSRSAPVVGTCVPDSVERDFIRSKIVAFDVDCETDTTYTVCSNDSPCDYLKSVPKQAAKEFGLPSSRREIQPMMLTSEEARGEQSPLALPFSALGQQQYSPTFVSGKLSFADIVKSPAGALCKSVFSSSNQFSQIPEVRSVSSPASCSSGDSAPSIITNKNIAPRRSPLASRENIPSNQWNNRQRICPPKWLKTFGSTQNTMLLDSALDSASKTQVVGYLPRVQQPQKSDQLIAADGLKQLSIKPPGLSVRTTNLRLSRSISSRTFINHKRSRSSQDTEVEGMCRQTSYARIQVPIRDDVRKAERVRSMSSMPLNRGSANQPQINAKRRMIF